MRGKYKVIKKINEGWETGADIGEILSVELWEGEWTLMLHGKAVCDFYSELATDNCVLIEE